MPNAYLQKLAKTTDKPIKELERLWVEAKALASKEGKKDNFAYITGIFKKMIGESLNINEMTYGDMLNNIPEGPVYLKNPVIKRLPKCNCGGQKFNASVNREGNPVWICLSCLQLHKRETRKRSVTNET